MLRRARGRPDLWADTPKSLAPEQLQRDRADTPGRLRPLPQNERLCGHGLCETHRRRRCLVVTATSHGAEARRSARFHDADCHSRPDLTIRSLNREVCGARLAQCEEVANAALALRRTAAGP